jgi:hypothetical protein
MESHSAPNFQQISAEAILRSSPVDNAHHRQPPEPSAARKQIIELLALPAPRNIVHPKSSDLHKRD